MSDLPVESRAFRQRLLAGLLGFFLGFISLLIAVGYVAILAKQQEGWFRAIHIGLHLVAWAFIGAMAIGWLAMVVTDRVHARLGWIRCQRCGRTLRHVMEACPCNPEWAEYLAHSKAMRHRYWRHRLVRYRRRLPSVIYAWLFVLAVTYVPFALINPGRRPTPADLAAGHLALCGLVVVLGMVLTDEMKAFNFGKRLRPRVIEFLTVLSVWPIVGLLFMLCWELLR